MQPLIPTAEPWKLTSLHVQTLPKQPSNLLEAGYPFVIEVTFRVTGQAAPLTGWYRVQVSLEGFGASLPEVDLPVQTIPASAPATQTTNPPFRAYSVSVTVPGALPPGAYRISSLITHLDEVEGRGPIAGFNDDSVVQLVPGFPPPLKAANKSGVRRYHQLLDAKFAGTITPTEIAELAEVDRRLAEQSEIEAEELERQYPETRAGRLEANLAKLETLVGEWRKVRQQG